MSESTPAALNTALAEEFDRQGWEYDLTLGTQLVSLVEERGRVDSGALSREVPAAFLHRNRTTRENVAAAIERAIGGRTPIPVPPPVSPVSIISHGDTYQLNIDHSQISGSSFNLGSGTLINIDAGAEKDDLLTALGALVSAALSGDWNSGAAQAIGQAIEQQGELTVAEARAAVLEAGQGQDLDRSRISELIEKVAVSGVGNFLSTALGLGLGDLLHLLG
jgi:hypothetical protein